MTDDPRLLPEDDLTEDPECCYWTPEVRPSKKVSTMFHDTTCGRSGAPTFDSQIWNYCPYCSARLVIVKVAQRVVRKVS